MDDDRFWTKVDRSGGPDACWEWMGARAPWGYGNAWISGVSRSAHRAAWEAVHGPISDGLWVLHRCDNPPCCNPAHLFLGTQADNMRDAARKGRVGVHNKKITEDDVRVIRSRVAAGGEFHRVIAADYGISLGQVGKIARRQIWAWVDA